jgi:tetratricopeptide (TPR) repeat protein
VAERIGHVTSVVFSRSLAAFLLTLLGQMRDAAAVLAELEPLTRLPIISRQALYVYEITLGCLRSMQGDAARALEHFERVRARTLAHGDVAYLMSVGAYAGEALQECGRWDESLAVLTHAWDTAGPHLYQNTIQVLALIGGAWR